MSQLEYRLQAMEKIFRAQSIALVGASSNPNKFGYMTLNSLIEGGYQGKIYPINPKGEEILGQRVFRTLCELPETPDLVIVIVPAQFVAGVLHQAAELGVKAGLILSAGFREAGRPDLEAEISAIAKKYSLHFVGPNVQGINYLPNKMCAMFFPVITTQGPFAIISQSGTVTAAISEWAADEGLGISAAINLGNQADLCVSDYLEFLSKDEDTKAIALYIEGLKDGHRFFKTLKQVAFKKNVAIMKGGRTVAGQKSVISHTGSLAGSYQVFSSACYQCGADMADDLETLYDKAKAMSTLNLPKGNRVLIISTSGGAGTIGADCAEAIGLTLPSLPSELIEELKKHELPSLAKPGNPFDLSTLSTEEFKKVITIADKFNVADTIMVNFGDPVQGATELILRMRASLNAQIAVTYFGGGHEEKLARIKMQKAGISVFPTPERAMRGISSVVKLANNRRQRGQ